MSVSAKGRTGVGVNYEWDLSMGITGNKENAY